LLTESHTTVPILLTLMSANVTLSLCQTIHVAMVPQVSTASSVMLVTMATLLWAVSRTARNVRVTSREWSMQPVP